MKNLLSSLFVMCLIVTASQANASVILQYHHIDTSTPAITSTTPEAFVEHLDYIASEEFQVIPLSEIVKELPNDIKETTDKQVAITFDDAYLNILVNAVPVLKDRQWPFTVFVSTQFVGQKGYLTWKQLQEVKAAGGSIANHTHSHLHMLRRKDDENQSEWLDRMEQEIQLSQTLLRKHGLAPEKLFAFPYGEYNLELLDLIKEMGFYGFGQQSGAVGKHAHPSLLPRYPLSGIYADLDSFKTKLHSKALPANTLLRSPMVNINPPSLKLIFDQDAALRLSELRCYGPGGLTNIEFISEYTVVATNKQPVPVGRSRYNCTMPMSVGSNFYWFSQLWIRKRSDGSWYPES